MKHPWNVSFINSKKARNLFGRMNLIDKIYSDMKDSVAKKEAEALKNPAMMNGLPSAKAKVEETQAKEQFEAKEKAGAFEKEVKQDINKTLK